ncbi:MAG: AAA family ATPase [Verrucomicrobia bacterium]|nr:AAA family ATPase [Verrucomicrobiota bacterium]
MNFNDEIALLIDARVPVIQVLTHDEERLVEMLEAVCARPGIGTQPGLYAWDLADQWTVLAPGKPVCDTSKEATPDTILRMIEQSPAPGIYLLRDFHQVWEAKKTVQRKLRNLVQKLPRMPVPKTIVITTPPDLMPAELRRPPGLKQDIVCLDLGRPDAEELGRIMRRVLGDRAVSGGLLGAMAETALGLSGLEAARTAAKVFVSARRRAPAAVGEWALEDIRWEKHRIIRESGALEMVENLEQASSVGGLEVLREWLELRKEAFSERAAAYGLDAPRGIALVGIPGTGKSLCAKVTAAMWRMPLLRLDMGAVFAGILGSSERNIREAIEISELISPCVLWVDEIEKAFAGSSGDSGTAARVLGTFLTWMAEKRKPVCVLATANDVDRLPPEFLRKGRFDEIFFLDLPTQEERAAILKVHIEKRGYSMISQKFNLPEVVRVTEGFVGAELEAVVKDAMFPAFMDGERELSTADLVKSAGEMVPLARSRAAHIQKLRQLVMNGEARNASRATVADEVKCDQIRGERILDLP